MEVPKEIVRQLLSGDEGLRKYVRVRPDGTAENLVAVPLELNGDGEPELEVHGTGDICGAQNCAAWVFRKTARGYEMLLDADSVQTVKPQKTSTRGYRDIITSMHGSAWDSGLTLYKFDGRRYRRVACYQRTYRYRDRRGNFRELRRPRATPEKCVDET